MHKLSLILLSILLNATILFSRQCEPKLLDKRLVIRKVVFSEYLLLKEKQIEKASEKLDELDTSNCFEIRSIHGKPEVGNLVRREGYGLSRYSVQIGSIENAVSFDSIAEIVEFKLDIDSYREDPKGTGEKNQHGFAVVAVVFGFVLVMTGMLLITVSGAALAGGK